MSAKPIVAATDGSEESMRAVDWAAREAVLRGVALRIVSAATLLPRMMEDHDGPEIANVTEALVSDRDVALATAAARATRASADLLVDTDHLTGAPAVAVAESGSGALMLVLGSRGAGAFSALVLGSVSRYAATYAPCPVVVVRDEITSSHRQVAVGVSDPESCAGALEFAFAEAALRQAAVLAVHAFDTPATGGLQGAFAALATPGAPAIEARLTQRLTALLAGCQATYPDVPVTQDVLFGHPGRTLAGLSARADLVVLGRHHREHGRTGAGAVTNAVLSHAHGPVVIVPSA